MSLSLICNKQHKQYLGGCLACLYEENSALRAEVERLKAELGETNKSCAAMLTTIHLCKDWDVLCKRASEALSAYAEALKK